MSDYKVQLDDLVISSNFGLGKVVGFEELDSFDGVFVVVEAIGGTGRSMIPYNESFPFRKVSTPEELEKNLKKLSKRDLKEFPSKKDRIAYFKERNSMQHLGDFYQTLIELLSLEDRGSAEEGILKSFVASLVLEIQKVKGVEESEAQEIFNQAAGIES